MPSVVRPRLPKGLIDELEGVKDCGRHDHNEPRKGRNRREERKDLRTQAKQLKASFFRTDNFGNKRTISETENVTQKAEKRRKSAKDGPSLSKPAPSPADTPRSKRSLSHDVKANDSLPYPGDHPSHTGRTARDEVEDAYISTLEGKLGIDSRKSGKNKYGAAFKEDGLLDLLLELDESIAKRPSTSRVAKKSHQVKLPESEELSRTMLHVSGVKASDDEWEGFEFLEDTEGVELVTENKETQSTSQRYFPPHLREARSSEGSEAIVHNVKLRRILKGLLNRLSEQNMEHILREVEAVYREFRRHDVTSTITDIVVESTCSHSLLLDSYIMLHAGLIACLHKIIGLELGAFFVQKTVTLFDGFYKDLKNEEPRDGAASSQDVPKGKECANLLVLLSDLYNLGVVACTLMYDIIREILDGEVREFDVELLLRWAKGCGVQLRQDDPTSLKDIIQIVQAKLANRPHSSRTKFMLETLNNLKNNKIKKHSSQNDGSEARDRIAKFVTGTGKKHQIHSHEALRVSLEDFRRADTKGKWWLVGAGWGGDPLAERQELLQGSSASSQVNNENGLLKLAKKQGMNTDIRRSIFVVLMSADDYVDACDRLSQLKLTEVQQREIIRVLLHCCGNEKSYNPFYTLVGQHLCREAHSHKVTMQFCLWDFLRSLGEAGVGGAELVKNAQDAQEPDFEVERISDTRIINVARAYAWWIAKDVVAITVLKTIDFTLLKPKTSTFMKELIIHLFVVSQSESLVPPVFGVDLSKLNRDPRRLENIVMKAARVPQLAHGIVHYMTLLAKAVEGESEASREFIRWAVDVTNDVLRTTVDTL